MTVRPQSKFVGATGNGGEFYGEEITEAQARFEAWLSEQAWEANADGEAAEEAEGLITDYLADSPGDEDHEEAIRQHARNIGKMTKNDTIAWKFMGD